MTAPLTPGVAAILQPGIRRLVAPNPGMMTGPGTNTYLLGEREYAVLDPGPVDAGHIRRLLALTEGRLRQILVTHTHTDHSPATMELARQSGARIVGRPAPAGPHQDASFAPDVVPEDGDCLRIDGDDWCVLHTPGHASNHVCYLHAASGSLCTGDHIINGSTVVIDPPDGNMQHYLGSLARLQREPLQRLLPGHGAVLDSPADAIAELIRHRLERERSVADALAEHPGSTVAALVPIVYAGVARQLHALAGRSLLAHLLKLAAEGRAARDGLHWRAL